MQMRFFFFLFLLSTAFATVLKPAERIIYGISPTYYSESSGKRIQKITKLLPELSELGVNTVWLQPFYQNNSVPGQLYDVVDYKSVHPELGNKTDLKDLIATAHKLNMEVIIDIPINHTSIRHPFAKDVIEKGEKSPFYTFYMHEKDIKSSEAIPYSRFYQVEKNGKSDFVVYFWKELPNINYHSQFAQDYIIECLSYWVKEYKVDGFRFDAIWGPLARNPHFINKMINQLKRLNPSIFLLAEDKASLSNAYPSDSAIPYASELFDAAYDWSSSQWYISLWSWAANDDNPEEDTIFNMDDTFNKVSFLNHAIKNSLNFNKVPLRFIENNDTPRFLQHHSYAKFKMASSLLFTLPGIPLMFYGQEIAYNAPQWALPAFEDGIRQYDEGENWNFFKRLTSLRKENPELIYGKWEPLEDPGLEKRNIWGFKRTWKGKTSTFLVNLSDKKRIVKLKKKKQFTNLINGKTKSGLVVVLAPMDVIHI